MPTTPNRPWLCPRDATCASTGRHDGDARAYPQGCRSGAALRAHADYMADWRSRTADGAIDHYIDAVGVRRRLRALYAIGYHPAAQARLLHVDRVLIARYLSGGITRVLESTRDRYEAAYAELAWADEPTGRIPDRTREAAAAKRWHPPAAWDDYSIDNPKAAPWKLRVVAEEPEYLLEALDAGRTAWSDLQASERIDVVDHLYPQHATGKIATRLGLKRVDVQALLDAANRRRTREADRVAAAEAAAALAESQRGPVRDPATGRYTTREALSGAREDAA